MLFEQVCLTQAEASPRGFGFCVLGRLALQRVFQYRPLMARRTEYSWDRLATEAAARMAEHDALPPDLREVSNECGIAVAREANVQRQSQAFMGMFA